MAPKIYLSEAERNRDLKKGGAKAGKGPVKAKVVKSSQTKVVGQKVRKTNNSPRVILQPPANNNRANNNNTRNTRGPNKQTQVVVRNTKAKPVITKPKAAPRQNAPRQAASRQTSPKVVVQQKSFVSNYRGLPGGNSQIAMARETAAAIARNNSHPHCKEVLELLRTQEKGWIDDQKFVDVLQTLLF